MKQKITRRGFLKKMSLVTASLALPSYLRADKAWDALEDMLKEVPVDGAIVESAVEKEINKWDPWILDFIDDLKFVKENVKHPRYNSVKHKISLPMCRMKSMNRDLYLSDRKSDDDYRGTARKVLEGDVSKHNLFVLDSIDHELEHAMFHGRIRLDHEHMSAHKKGLDDSKHYSGPDKKEYRDNLLRIMETKQKSALLEMCDIYLTKNHWDHNKEKITEEFGSVEDFIKTFDPSKSKNRLLIFDFNIKKKELYREIINETNARMVDSLMNVYTGPTTINLWTLEKDDLEFLAKHKYKGKPVFGKALEKYHIAMQLKNEGMGWEDVQTELQYATSYSYEGKKYCWPENGFRFKKPIKVEK